MDSSVWIDYFRGTLTSKTTRLDHLLGREDLAIGDLILAEVLQGFDEERDCKTAETLLTSLTVITLGGQDVALQAAANFRRLRRFGVTVRKTIDSIIATRCIKSGFALLHDDRDFEPFVRYLGLEEVT